MREAKSTIFSWNPSDFEALLATCETDGIFDLVQKHVPQGSKVLESGCGPGRYVRYLHDRGWQVTGLEYSADTVAMVHGFWPDLDVRQGDASASPFEEGEFDAVLSLGVVEHFPEGLISPLGEIHRVLRSGGIAIISAPCLNRIRQSKRSLWWYDITGLPRAVLASIIKHRKMTLNRLQRQCKYHVYPAYGEFIEYRLTPEQFLAEIEAAGFEILEHKPHAVIDGIYHELNPLGLLVKFRNWKFKVSFAGEWLNTYLAQIPFFHCHMQVVVVRKP